MENTEATTSVLTQPIGSVTINVVVKAGPPAWAHLQIGIISTRLLFIEDEKGEVIYQSEKPFTFSDAEFNALSEVERLDYIKEQTKKLSGLSGVKDIVTAYAVSKNLLAENSNEKVVLEALRFEAA